VVSYTGSQGYIRPEHPELIVEFLVAEKGDVSDWFDAVHDTTELLQLIDQATAFDPKAGVRVDVSKFRPLSSQELPEILGLTIKRDEHNKLTAFLCELSAYTEDSQFNISCNAPSSTGSGCQLIVRKQRKSGKSQRFADGDLSNKSESMSPSVTDKKQLRVGGRFSNCCVHLSC